jgi:EAL domain-containing protein (putative c-di-GMP-specific phosphodiesterase class I)
VAWRQEGLPRLSMAVNLSARQFYDEHLVSDVTAILAETGMEAPLLEVEISEALLMQDVDKTVRILNALKGVGVRIAINDFGAGYCSLVTLNRFPLDTIKIDRAFISEIAGAAVDENLTEALVALSGALSVTVVAQGVETKAQADFLREHACDQFQGFYVNVPVPAAEIVDLLRTADVADSGSHAAA